MLCCSTELGSVLKGRFLVPPKKPEMTLVEGCPYGSVQESGGQPFDPVSRQFKPKCRQLMPYNIPSQINTDNTAPDGLLNFAKFLACIPYARPRDHLT